MNLGNIISLKSSLILSCFSRYFSAMHLNYSSIVSFLKTSRQGKPLNGAKKPNVISLQGFFTLKIGSSYSTIFIMKLDMHGSKNFYDLRIEC